MTEHTKLIVTSGGGSKTKKKAIRAAGRIEESAEVVASYIAGAPCRTVEFTVVAREHLGCRASVHAWDRLRRPQSVKRTLD